MVTLLDLFHLTGKNCRGNWIPSQQNSLHGKLILSPGILVSTVIINKLPLNEWLPDSGHYLSTFYLLARFLIMASLWGRGFFSFFYSLLFRWRNRGMEKLGSFLRVSPLWSWWVSIPEVTFLRAHTCVTLNIIYSTEVSSEERHCLSRIVISSHKQLIILALTVCLNQCSCL